MNNIEKNKKNTLVDTLKKGARTVGKVVGTTVFALPLVLGTTGCPQPSNSIEDDNKPTPGSPVDNFVDNEGPITYKNGNIEIVGKVNENRSNEVANEVAQHMIRQSKSIQAQYKAWETSLGSGNSSSKAFAKKVQEAQTRIQGYYGANTRFMDANGKATKEIKALLNGNNLFNAEVSAFLQCHFQQEWMIQAPTPVGNDTAEMQILLSELTQVQKLGGPTLSINDIPKAIRILKNELTNNITDSPDKNMLIQQLEDIGQMNGLEQFFGSFQRRPVINGQSRAAVQEREGIQL